MLSFFAGMRNPNDDPKAEERAIASRISLHRDLGDLFKTLEALQIPCPWGNLAKGEGIERFHPDMPEMDRIPYVPVALALGAGRSPWLDAYRSVASVDQFGKIIYSDIFDPRMCPKDYISLDLTDPPNINLFGFRVHALISIAVFTYDGLGVNFKDTQNEFKAAQALNDLLMEGGIIANENISRYNRQFENIFLTHFGFQVVRSTHSVVLQKPF